MVELTSQLIIFIAIGRHFYSIFAILRHHDTQKSIEMARIEKTDNILSSSADWRIWYDGVYSIATSGKADVWQYIDPEKETPTPMPTEPQLPIPGAYKEGATSIAQLEKEQADLFRMECSYYGLQKTNYDNIREGISRINSHILSTVASKNKVYIDGKRSVHEQLRALRNKFAPTSENEQFRIRMEYKKMMTYNRRENIDNWITRWEIVHADAVRASLAEVQEHRAIYDFLLALQTYNEGMSRSELSRLRDRIDDGKTTTFQQVVDRIRQEITIFNSRQAYASQASHSAFSTYKGDSHPYQSRPQCPCGKKHFYNECFYLNPDVRPDGWRPNNQVKRRLDEMYKNDSQFKARIDSALENYKRRKNSTNSNAESSNRNDSNAADSSSSSTPSRFANFATRYHIAVADSQSEEVDLSRCWTLDNASDVHLINHRQGFTKTRDAEPGETLMGGKETYNIEAFGTAEVEVDTPMGFGTVMLHEVALVPGFLSNLVSLKRLMKKGVHWNSEDPFVLRKNSRTFIHLKAVGDHFVLQKDLTYESIIQHNALSTTSQRSDRGLRKSAQPLNTKFTGEMIHRIFAHPNPEIINHLQSATRGATIDNESASAPNSIECVTCATAKPVRLISRRTDNEEWYNEVGAMWSYDIIYVSKAYNGNKFVSHLQDMNTGFNLVYTHYTVSEALSILEDAFTMIKNVYNYHPKLISLDGEQALKNQFESMLGQFGIRNHRSAPRTPEQSKAERAGRMLTVKARAMMIEANMPEDMWPEAFNTAAYIANRTPTERLKWKTPFEMFASQKPMIGHMHPFGCRAYAMDLKIPKLNKMRPRAQIGYLMGYDSTNIFRIWMPSKGRVIRTRDVRFDDSRLYHPTDIDLGALQTAEVEEVIQLVELPDALNQRLAEWETSSQNIYEEFEDFGLTNSGIHIGISTAQESIEKSAQTEPNTTPSEAPNRQPFLTPDSMTPQSSRSPSRMPSPSPDPADTTPNEPPLEPVRREVPEQPRRQRIGREVDDSNVIEEGTKRSRVRSEKGKEMDIQMAQKEDRKGKRAAYAKALRVNEELTAYHTAFFTSAQTEQKRTRVSELPAVPKSWKQLLSHPKKQEFMKACSIELNDLESKGTFRTITTPTSTTMNDLLPLMWVFTYKSDSDGYLMKYKARLVARGDLHTTEDDTYAATVAMQTFRAMMAISAAFDLEVRSYDVKNAYVNAILPNSILCEMPSGYQQNGKCFELLRALYGLNISPNLWYNELIGTLNKLGLHQVPAVNCLFTNDWLSLLFYVDDIVTIYARKYQSKYDEFESKLLHIYEIRSLGHLENFLGIRVVRDRTNRLLYILQDSHIESIASKFDFKLDEKAPSIPIPTRTDLTPYTGQAPIGQIRQFQQKVGHINYIAITTRPDIARSASKLSEFLRNPSPAHMEAVDHLLRYMIGTRHYAICYNGLDLNGLKTFEVASDASFADAEDRKSSFGFCFQLYGGCVHYKAAKQKTVTTSSTEAELLSVSSTVKELMWWIRFYKNIGFELEEKYSVYCDNQQTIRLLTMEEPKLITKLKHVDIHSHWLRQEIQQGRINIEYLETSLIVADGFTKQLPRQRHEEFVRLLKLVDIQGKLGALDQGEFNVKGSGNGGV